MKRNELLIYTVILMKLRIIILNNNNKKPGIKEHILRDCVLIGKTNVW